MDHYLSDIPPPLSLKEENELVTRYRAEDDIEARNKLILHNIGNIYKVIEKCAWDYAGDINDLIGHGIFGFIQTMDRKLELPLQYKLITHSRRNIIDVVIRTNEWNNGVIKPPQTYTDPEGRRLRTYRTHYDYDYLDEHYVLSDDSEPISKVETLECPYSDFVAEIEAKIDVETLLSVLPDKQAEFVCDKMGVGGRVALTREELYIKYDLKSIDSVNTLFSYYIRKIRKSFSAEIESFR